MNHCKNCKEKTVNENSTTCSRCLVKILEKALENGLYDAAPSELQQGCVFPLLFKDEP